MLELIPEFIALVAYIVNIKLERRGVMKACVDKSLCIGCGLCESISPSVFKMNEEGLAEAIENEFTDEQLSEAEEAKSQCPSEAISVE